MQKNILEFLEHSANKYPNKVAFKDENSSAIYSDLLNKSKSIGSEIAKSGKRNSPYLVFIDKSVECIEAMLGIVYSGNFYVVIDVHMPEDRLKNICETLSPIGAVTVKSQELPSTVTNLSELYFCDNEYETDDKALSAIREKMIDTDPLYALFTSGSTGVPKGAIVTHRNVITYTDWVCNTFDITEKTVYGSQAPFYFSMSVTDVFSTLKSGGTLVIIPKSLFIFPVKLLEYMAENSVNTIYWVPSALSIVANWKALDFADVPTLRKIMFAGESMPIKQLNIWRKHFPNAMFANLFGPTETTDICTYYVVDREFSDDESLPIGKHCNNCDVFVVSDDGKEADFGEEGELYVRGSFVIPGYYNNPEKTASVFIQNPLNALYPEIVYRTGDIVKYNEYGELLYIGRKDFQIKHMGYRIELGEIETAAGGIDGVRAVCCVYDSTKSKIILCYEGDSITTEQVTDKVQSKVPEYMIPEVVFRIAAMPHNANGKIDRKYILSNYKQLKKEAKEKKL